jgi:hypothetical protein
VSVHANLCLLAGPQRPVANLGQIMGWAGIPQGKVAVIAAGWQEGEQDLEDLAALVERPLINLRLYQRAEQLFSADAQLRQAYRQRQDRLISLQRLYRARLKSLAGAARQILVAEEDADLVEHEQRHAIAQLRALDRHHLQRTDAIHREFDDVLGVDCNPRLGEHAAEVAADLGDAQAVIIAGGNVLVLLNRMRLFGVERLLHQIPVVAWSAGAMVLAERIVLYHDHSPQGRRNAELKGSGFGLLPGYVFLPDAGHRLKTSDSKRLELLSRRFRPDACLTLDNGASVRFDGGRLCEARGSRQITRGGRLARVRST